MTKTEMQSAKNGNSLKNSKETNIQELDSYVSIDKVHYYPETRIDIAYNKAYNKFELIIWNKDKTFFKVCKDSQLCNGNKDLYIVPEILSTKTGKKYESVFQAGIDSILCDPKITTPEAVVAYKRILSIENIFKLSSKSEKQFEHLGFNAKNFVELAKNCIFKTYQKLGNTKQVTQYILYNNRKQKSQGGALIKEDYLLSASSAELKDATNKLLVGSNSYSLER